MTDNKDLSSYPQRYAESAAPEPLTPPTSPFAYIAMAIIMSVFLICVTVVLIAIILS